MNIRIARLIATSLTLALLLTMIPFLPTQAQADAGMAFHRTWERTDKPVADGVVSRTWMWGPDAASSQLQEQYAEAPGGTRTVIYSHKSRMEINHNPGVSPDSVWYVTNGLLVQELISGRMQVGDNTYLPRQAADVNVAGDFDDPVGVTYRLMGFVLDEPAAPEGSTITMSIGLAAASLIRDNSSMSVYGVTGGVYVPETGHTVASPFWGFMNSSGVVYENGQFVHAPLFLNPFYATGFPITEAYWAYVKVGGTYTDVLLQCFERRCLTYTPSNDPAWRVEAGNVGLHYHAWRYADSVHQPAPQPDPTSYEPWIYGVTKEFVIDHVKYGADLRGEWCSQLPPTNVGTEIISCYGHWAGIDYDYQVQVFGPSEYEVVVVSTSLWQRDGNIQNTDAVAAFIIGWMAALPYSDADPEYMWEVTANNIRESGMVQVGSATFVLNQDPTFYGWDLDLTRERTLEIWATGY